MSNFMCLIQSHLWYIRVHIYHFLSKLFKIFVSIFLGFLKTFNLRKHQCYLFHDLLAYLDYLWIYLLWIQHFMEFNQWLLKLNQWYHFLSRNIRFGGNYKEFCIQFLSFLSINKHILFFNRIKVNCISHNLI